MQINVLDYLEQSSIRSPHKVAFSGLDRDILYIDLVHQAKAIGSNLSSLLEGETKKPIGVFIERDVNSLIGFMGVVYSGNFYVPLDAQMPHSRLKIMLETIKPPVIISTHKDEELIQKLGFSGKLIFVEDVSTVSINNPELTRIRNQAIDTDPLYAIFTSGSTGIPKCVVVSHRSVIDLIEHFTNLFGFSEESVFGNQAPFDFDVSVKDIYSTLKNGASMHVLPRELFSFPGELIKSLNTNRINVVIWATSALRIIANLNALAKEIPTYLKKVMFSGEVMPNKVLNYWRSYIPNARYVNLYGPTEITCNCSYFIVNRKFADNEMLPIGFPFPNTDIILLNESNNKVNGDEIGEICVRGSSLALGYFDNPGEGKYAFCQNPLNPHYHDMIYRTGDLGRFNDKGELLFLSRKDNQIKHMGHRIELGEVEVAINALDFIDAACCLFDAEEDKLILFYQSSQKCDREILLGLRDYLPRYMMPNKFMHFEKLPMNKNAKIDRIKLKEQLTRAEGK